MATFTVNTDANPETTTVDGGLTLESAPGASFATLHDAADAGSTTQSSLSGTMGYLRAHATDNNEYNLLQRFICLFDVSGFTGDPDNITGITLDFYPDATSDDFAEAQSICLVLSAPTSNTDLAIGDYNSLGTTVQATDLPIAGVTVSQYNSFTLNAAGIATVKAAIAGDGVVKFGIRLSCDRTATAPTWTAGGEAYVSASYADNDTTEPRTNIPRLVITYNDIIDVTLTLPTMNVNLNMPVPELSLLDYVWNFITKHTSIFTNKNKNSASWTNKSKNDATWTFKEK